MRQKGSGHPCAPGRDPFRADRPRSPRPSSLPQTSPQGQPLGHALIQLGLAYEVESKDIAMEALALTSVQNGYLYDNSSDSSLNKKFSISSDSILDLLDLMSKDGELDSLPDSRGFGDLESIFKGIKAW
ncbi:hypothetical protein E4U46_007209 [Claviceps purpurea]|nr:hypothetical protein E4U46_007209 [Claviceps purpurea]